MKSNGVENISEHLCYFARKNPDKPVLLHPVKVSYKDFCKLVDTYATGFIESGIEKETKTIVLLKPGVDLFATIFALLRIGAVPVLIDPGMGRKAMVKALVKADAGAFVGISKSMLLKYISPKVFKNIHVWISSGPGMGTKHLSAFRRLGSKNYEVARTNPDDITAIFFTSGSTGPAKGVVYTKRMMEAQIACLKNHFNYNPREIDLCTFPLIGLFSMCLGLSVVLADMDMMHPARLQPDKLILNIYWFGCTYMFCSPMVLQKLTEYCKQEQLKLNSLKRVMTAGAPVLPDLLHEFAKIVSADAEIHTPYGATEALPVTDIHHKELLGLYKDEQSYANGICVGYPLKNVELKIIHISDEGFEKQEDVVDCEKDEVGEIVVRGEIVSQKYLKDPEADRLSKIAADSENLLWHRTGDLGRMDEMGRVWYYGRKSQRVETANGTLFTIPTEAIFNQHQNVERSALVGIVRDGKTEPVICIQAKKGADKHEKVTNELKELALQHELTQNISEFIFLKKFPVDARHNAKIYREKLAEWVRAKRK